MQGVVVGALATACSRTLRNELEGVLALLQSVTDGQGPSSDAAGKYSDFYQACLKRMESFYNLQPKDSVAAGGLVGRPALLWKYAEAEKAADAGEAVELKDLGAFRAYSWVLSADQARKANGWIAEAAKIRAASFHKAIADGSANGQKTEQAASSSSAPPAPAPESPDDPTAAEPEGVLAAPQDQSRHEPQQPAEQPQPKRHRKKKVDTIADEPADPSHPHAGLAKFFKAKA